MKITQVNERTFRVELNDAELDDVTHEAVYSQISTLDVMKAVFIMSFVQLCDCRYFRRTLGTYKSENPNDNESHGTLETEVGG